MLLQQRQEWIMQRLQTHGAVTATEVVNALQVSLETVRRDLLSMERRGLLRRVHGGAVAEGRMKPFYDLDRRNQDYSAQKQALARVAVSRLCPGDVIGVDSGSTAVFFAEAIKSSQIPLTVVTHCASVFSILKDQPHITLILCGGHYNPDEKVFYGRLTQQTLSGIYMNKVFLFPSAISLESGICDYQQELLQVEQVYLSRGEQVFILADSSKFEKKALLKLTDMQQEFCYITDPDLPQSLKELYQENHITLLTEVS